jgi:hypothetical protein
MLGLGLGVLRSVAGEATGTITQDGATTSFTSARIVRRRRSPDGGNKDRLEVDLELAASGIAGVEPRTDAQVALTGDDSAWVVVRADPIAPGGTVVAWAITLRTWVER